MKKVEYIERYGEDAWKKHLLASREWNKQNSERHSAASREWRKQNHEYYKETYYKDNIKYSESKKKWRREHSIEYNARYRPQIKKRLVKTLTSHFKRYCADAICLIENYYIALQEDFKGWCIHHRLELHSDNSVRFTSHSLKKLNLYYNRPASELIFLRSEEHIKMHHLNKKHGSKYIDTSKITVNSLSSKEYHRQYSKLRSIKSNG